MRIARLIYPINVLGRGSRIGLWLAGCPHHCEGCSNPELWAPESAEDISTEAILAAIEGIFHSNDVQGITITGGEPFWQATELSVLIKRLKALTGDILVYSGYTLAELIEMRNADVDSVLSAIAVLIDGRYIQERNSMLPLRGSDNQVIHILDTDYERLYREYLSSLPERSQVQNFLSLGSVISVGIHKPSFNDDFDRLMRKNGLGER